MASGEISEELKRFIHAQINSVEQLEVLLLLKSKPHKEWNATEVSEALFIQPASAAVRLAALHSGGLLSTPNAAQPNALFRYQPSSPILDRLVGSLELAYKERKHSVITLIFSKPNENIRVFSDAFKIRRDD